MEVMVQQLRKVVVKVQVWIRDVKRRGEALVVRAKIHYGKWEARKIAVRKLIKRIHLKEHSHCSTSIVHVTYLLDPRRSPPGPNR